jgi:hypothetical protein
MMQEVADVIQKHLAIMKSEEGGAMMAVPVIASSTSVAPVGMYI